MTKELAWLAVVGTREVDDGMRRDLQGYVGAKIAAGCGIVSGGATGADHEAALLAYRAALTSEHFRIYLPVELERYCASLLERGRLGKCRSKDAAETVELLRQIARDIPGVIYDRTSFTAVNVESFHARNRQIVELADELVAFRVDMSAGTSYTIQEAQARGIPVRVFDY